MESVLGVWLITYLDIKGYTLHFHKVVTYVADMDNENKREGIVLDSG